MWIVVLVKHVSEPTAAWRFTADHTLDRDAAWLVLFMIFNVVWSLLLCRGAQVNTGNIPFGRGAFASESVARALKPLGRTANDVIETAGILAALGIVLEPVGRMGLPHEIAEAAVWLCSDAASFVTGHAMAVDGGFVAQ